MAFGNNSRERRSPKRLNVRRRLLVERLTNRRVLAAITGVVFSDADLSLRHEADESVLSDRLLYLDVNSNAQLDSGEPLTLSQDDGSFEFDDVVDGEYLLRLFNGAQSQAQSSPVNATVEHSTVQTCNGIDVMDHAAGLLTLTNDSIIVGDLNDGTLIDIPVASNLSRMQALPSGEIVVIGGQIPGETAWVVNPATQSVSSLDLSGSDQSFSWSEIAIDANGNGVVLNQSTSVATVISIDATDPDGHLEIHTSGTVVPADAQVLASDSGNRSVFGWNGPSGLQLSLWSNPTSTWITNTPVEVAGTSQLLAYDDASGLLALRTDDGGVSLHDANASFAQLHSLPNATGTIGLDGERELLVTVSDAESTLQLIDLRSAETIADLNVDLSTVGQVAALRVQTDPNAILVQGSSGATKVSLIQPAAHEITVLNGTEPAPVLFGVTLNGDNTAPLYATQTPEFTIKEDQFLATGTPGALQGVVDNEGDHFVIFLADPADNGDASLQVTGSLNYRPADDFNGTDTISVIVHDGVGGSGVTPLKVIVTPVPDDPTDIDVDIQPFPENIPPGRVLGPVDVIDVDLIDDHQIVVNDQRFRVEGGQLIFVGEAGDLDFEQDPIITISITAIDPVTLAEIDETVSLTLIDANDPITDITPHSSGVNENVEGAEIATLVVHDDDRDQTHTISVDDERFEVVLDRLKLADGVSLDFEAESSVTVVVTASEDGAGGNSYSQEIVIAVGDEVEQPSSISLESSEVVELEPGAVVGDLQIDGNSVTDGYVVTVDDSRFEIVNSELRLKEDEWVELAVQDEIEVVITAQDVEGVHDALSETFDILVVENPTPYHTDRDPFDVDDNQSVTASDALIIINYLNTFGPGPIGHGNPAMGYDVNLDKTVTALDALLVLNEINRLAAVGSGGTVGGEGNGGDEPEGEGEQANDTPEGEFSQNDLADGVVKSARIQASDFLGPFQPVLQAVQSQNTPADINEMKDLVFKNAKLLGLSDAPLSTGQLKLNYQVIKAVLAESESTKGFAEDVDASLESFLNDQK